MGKCDKLKRTNWFSKYKIWPKKLRNFAEPETNWPAFTLFFLFEKITLFFLFEKKTYLAKFHN